MRQPASEAKWESLFSRRSESVIKPGLERIREAWQALSFDKLSIKFILVAGTNGKGSTSGMLWHLLAASGYRCGLFTSPHLLYFRERFQVSTEETTDHHIEESLESIRSKLAPDIYDQLSFFELSTLIAVDIFRRNQCEYGILEVGLGGRLDSTNIVDPMITAVTSIELDHQQWLGTTYSEIAGEKLGISRPGTALYWNETDTELKGLEPLLDHHATGLDVPIFRQGREFGTTESEAYRTLKSGQTVSATFPQWLQSGPQFLKKNFSLSLAIFSRLIETENPVSEDSDSASMSIVSEALAKFAKPEIPWPHSLQGRFQSLTLREPGDTESRSGDTESRSHAGTRFILDVAHNKAAIEEFRRNTARLGFHAANPLPLIVSILSDKDINSMLDVLKKIGSPIILFKACSDRSFSTEHLEARHKDIIIFDQFAAAWEYAKEQWLKDFQTLAVCGSFLAVGEVLHYFSVSSQDKIPAVHPGGGTSLTVP